MAVVCRLGFDWKCTFTILLLTSIRTVPAGDVLIKCADIRQSYFKYTCFANWRTPFGQMDFRVGGPSCAGSAADESPDIGAIRYCFRFLSFWATFKSGARNASGVEKLRQISHFLTPCKNRGGWCRCLYEFFVPHIGFKHRYTFYPAVWSHVGRLTKN